MAISTYAELKTAIASWLDREDLTDIIPDFIALSLNLKKSLLLKNN